MNDRQPHDGHELLTVQQVADWLAVSSRTVHRLAASGALVKRSIGGSTRFLRKDVNELVARAGNGTEAEIGGSE
jgi:excisionase family DNA binding protein